MRKWIIMVFFVALGLPCMAQFTLDARTKSILDLYYLKKGSNSVTSANIMNGSITTNDLDSFIVSTLMSMTNGIQWNDIVIATNTVSTNLGQNVQFNTTGAGSCATSMIGRAYWNAGSLRYYSSVTFNPGYGEVPRFLIQQGDADWIFEDVENGAYYTNFNLQAEYMPMNDEIGSVLVSGFSADSFVTNSIVITNTVLEALIHAMISITNIPDWVIASVKSGMLSTNIVNTTNSAGTITYPSSGVVGIGTNVPAGSVSESGFWELTIEGMIQVKTNWAILTDTFWTTNSSGEMIVRTP